MNRNPVLRPANVSNNGGMYRAPYQQYPNQLSQQQRGVLGYPSTLATHRSTTQAPGPQLSGAAGGQVSYLRPQNQSYGFSTSLQQPSSLQSQGQGQLHPGSNTQPSTTGLNSSSLSNQLSLNSTQDPPLDLNDFPALGAGSTGTGPAAVSTNSTGAMGSSYASQAQHHLLSGSGVVGLPPIGNGISRDFTNPDEFPALGDAPSSAPSNGANLTQGLNGYQSQAGQTSLLSSQARNAATGLTIDDKRVYGLKNSNPSQTPSTWSQHPGGPTNSTGAYGAPATNGLQQQSSNPAISPYHPTQMQQHNPTSAPQPQDESPPPDPKSATSVTNGQQQPQPYQPHTPADQVLHSPADRWGLLALVRSLRSQTEDSLSTGQDLSQLLEVENPGSVYRTFATPWADFPTTAGAPASSEPNYHLPSCYNVAPPPPNAKKAAQFSDETLFFTFYAMPRDAFQELAAQELYNRNWRYHKQLRLWITLEAPQSNPSGPNPTSNNGSDQMYTVWDIENWERVQKSLVGVDMRELENRQGVVVSLSNSNGPNSGSSGSNAISGLQPSGAGNSNGGALGVVGAERTHTSQGHQYSQQQTQLRV